MAMEKEINTKVSALTPENWSELQDLYERVIKHKGSFLSEGGGEEIEPNVIEMPYTIEAPIVAEARKFFYDNGLVIPFDWSEWSEGRAMFRKEGEDKFNNTSLTDVIKLFTAVIRNDRFNDGAWADIFETGDGAKLLKQLLTFKPKEESSVDWIFENLHNTKPKPQYVVPQEEIDRVRNERETAQKRKPTSN